jgi:tripartite-type tricarboxylate transporter receptor subunit TctC
MKNTSNRRQAVGSLLVAGLLSAGALAAPAIAQDKKAALADGFPNKPIVLLVIDEPGSVDSIYASQIAEAASKISPQPVVVEHRIDFTNFGTWEGIAWIKDQGELASEGYITYVLTLPDAMIDMAAIDIETMTGMTTKDLNTVIATERVPFMFIQRSDAPWGNTIQGFVDHAKANPGTVRHITGGPGGGMDAAMRFWLAGLGVTVLDVIGGNPTERALAVASGEGDITAAPPDVLMPHFDAGKVALVMGAGEAAFPAPWDGVPTSASLGIANDPFKQTRTIATSPDVSDEHRQWLYELFSAAAKDPGFVEQRGKVIALEAVDLDPAEAKALSELGLTTAIDLFKTLGIYWADQQ